MSIESRRGVGAPITIAEHAVEFAGGKRSKRGNRGERNSFEERDQIWAVFDRDEHERYDEAVRLCEENGVRIARSNPCFEVWLILHERDYHRPDDRKEVQNELRRLRPEFSAKGAKIPNCDEMVERLLEAEKRGRELCLRREEEGEPHGRPSTTVGELTKAIREMANSVRQK